MDKEKKFKEKTDHLIETLEDQVKKLEKFIFSNDTMVDKKNELTKKRK